MLDRVSLSKSCSLFPKRIVRYIEYGFFIIGVLALGYYGVAMLDAYLYQRYLSRTFNQRLEHQPAEIKEKVVASIRNGTLPEGTLVGRIQIPRLDLSVMVLEGVAERTLHRGAGHIPETAWPGDSGNMGIAGHRDTFFRKLRYISKGDKILLSTIDRRYTYVVDDTEVVDPEDVHVLDASDEPSLTLVTCYPFDYVGHAPRRFIVRARRTVDNQIPNPTADPGA